MLNFPYQLIWPSHPWGKGDQPELQNEELRQLWQRTAHAIDAEVRGWKFHMEDDPQRNYRAEDASDWQTVDPGFAWQGENTTCWFRKELVLPQQMFGIPLAGHKVAFRVGIDDDGEIYVDGELRQSFHWDFGYAPIADAAEPGRTYRIDVHGINRGGPGGMLFARLHFPEILPRLADFKGYVLGFPLMERIFDLAPDIRDKCERRMKSSLRRLDWEALERCEGEVFWASFGRAVADLAPITEMLRRYKVQLISDSHIDMAWLWPWRETVDVCRDTFRSVLNIMEEYPNLVYNQSQAKAYQWMEEYHPEILEGIKQRVKEGRWELSGGMWVEPDCQLPCGESFVRQHLEGQRYYQQQFGRMTTVGWVPDSFGYTWALPQIMSQAGIKYFLTTKLGWNDTTRFPYNLFWWQGADGTKVLSCQPVTGLGQSAHPHFVLEDIFKHQLYSGYSDSLFLFGIGDHGGGPSRDMAETVEAMSRSPLFPTVIQGTAEEYFQRAEKFADIPTYNNELYVETHRGTYTSQARTKRHNRKCEHLLLTTEKFSTLADLLTGDTQYPRADMQAAWRKVLFNQFHDVLPGTSIPPVYVDTEKDYAEVYAAVGTVLDSALQRLSASVATKPGESVILFNPLSWEHTGAVQIPLPAGFTGNVQRTVLKVAGKKVPLQWVAGEPGYWVAVIPQVPSVGYIVGQLVPGRSSGKDLEAVRVSAQEDTITLENSSLSAAIDAKTGLLRSLTHKASGREALEQPGNLLQIFEDPTGGNAWDIHVDYEKVGWNLEEAEQVTVLESGPVRATVRVVKVFRQSRFIQDITLYRQIPRLDCHLEADWHERKHLLKVAFPTALHTDGATYEIPYATIQRSTQRDLLEDQAKYEVSAQQWADLSVGAEQSPLPPLLKGAETEPPLARGAQGGSGFGLSLMNDCKYGYDIRENVMRLSLLRAPTDPDPMADEGQQFMTYSVYPHQGDWRTAQTVRRAMELNQPLLVRESGAGFPACDPQGSTDGPACTAPQKYSAFAVEPQNVILSACKPAEDDSRVILRFYECEGQPAKVNLTLPKEVKSAQFTDLLERPTAPAKVRGKKLSFPLRPYQIQTVAVEF